MRTLFVSTHLPHSDIPQAGHYIAHQKLLAYKAEGPVLLFAVSNSWEQSFNVEFPVDSIVVYFSRLRRIFNVVCSVLLPTRVSNRYSKAIHARIHAECERFRPDRIHYEYTASAAYWIPGIKSIWKEQDITFESLRRRSSVEKNPLKKAFFALESLRMKRWELVQAKKMDEILTVTGRDKENLASNGIDAAKISVEIPVGTAYKSPDVERSKFNLLFFGALNRFENRASLDWFLDAIFPIVLRSSVEFKLHVVGGGLKSYSNVGCPQNVVFHGYVKDPSEIFSSCMIAVAPIVSGAGIKIKVLDYLASGLKVVSTSIGAEGIESDQIAICDNEREFALAILAIANTSV